MQPFYTSNDSEITRLEGLYLKERTPPAVISGVPLNDVAIVAETIRGPVDVAVECSSAARVAEVFGGRDEGISNLFKSMVNRPFGRVRIVRVAAAAAATASLDVDDGDVGSPTDIIQIDASSPGAWGNNVQVAITDATDGDVDHFNLVVTYLGRSRTYENLDVTAGHNNLEAVIGTDFGNLVKVTKLADGRPKNLSAQGLTDVSGTDGSIADSDYTSSGRGLNVAAVAPNCSVVTVAEYMSSAVKALIKVLAAETPDRIWILGANSGSVGSSSAISDVASYRDQVGRMVYAFNHAYTIDPATGTEILTSPMGWLASILSQIDVDIHPGEEDTKQFTAGITRLAFESLARGDYISLREAGICALERDDGFSFVSGVNTCLVPGKREITWRRMSDFILKSLARVWRYDVKKKNTETIRDARRGKTETFLETLRRAERVVDAYRFDDEILNTDAERGNGVERGFLQVKFINHALHLVLETEMGTNVSIREVA